ncbi:MAG TPA: deoxyribonuclease IV, partial [Longimicrobiales bacterium]|nr:deoxyribonuclease IV [Longimicrobiales bacterium]
EVPGRTMVLLETTAGAGRVLGSRFEELAEMIERIPQDLRDRVGVCVDTCHVWAAGYDLAGDYDGVMAEIDRRVGLDRVRLFHLNDSVGGLGSHRDRHADIGTGTLGDEPFRRLVNDPRFRDVPKVLETPKGDDPAAADRKNLARLRGYRAG